MPIKTLDLSPANIGRPFAVLIAQPDASALVADVILRAKMTARFGVVLAETFVEIARETVPAPATANNVGRRWVAIGGVPGASAYQAECNAADLEDLQIQAGPFIELDAAALWLEHTAQASPGGTSTAVEVSISPASAGVLSVGVEQDDASAEPVLVVIEASDPSSPTGYAEVGRRRFNAPAPGPGRRLVAFAAIPGALSYRVTATSLDGARPYAQMGPFFDLQAPMEWIVDGRPIPGPSPFGQSAETVTYVATNGDDATGERGNILRPFLTLDAAMAAADSGDTILVAPGDYAPATVPAAKSFTIAGQAGPANRPRLLGGAGTGLLALLVAQNLTLQNLEFVTTNPLQSALTVGGDGVLNNSNLLVEDCQITGPFQGAYVENLNTANFRNCQGALITLQDNSAGGLLNCSNQAFIAVTDPTPPQIPIQGWHRIRGSRAGLVSVNGNAWVSLDKATAIANFEAGSAFTALGPDGRIECEATLLSCLVHTQDGVNPISLDGSQIDSLTLIADDAIGPRTISARGATIRTSDMTSTAGQALILDFTGGQLIDQFGSTFGANCHWRRDGGAVVANAVAPGASTLLFGVDMVGAPFAPTDLVLFSVEPLGALAVPALATDHVTVAAQASTGVDLINGYAGAQTLNIFFALQPS